MSENFGSEMSLRGRGFWKMWLWSLACEVCEVLSYFINLVIWAIRHWTVCAICFVLYIFMRINEVFNFTFIVLYQGQICWFNFGNLFQISFWISPEKRPQTGGSAFSTLLLRARVGTTYVFFFGCKVVAQRWLYKHPNKFNFQLFRRYCVWCGWDPGHSIPICRNSPYHQHEGRLRLHLQPLQAPLH